MTKIYIIPGYKHCIDTDGYKELIKKLKNSGYETQFVSISWKYHIMSDYIKEASHQISSTENSLLLGFSFGAMISLKLAEDYKFYNVVLCSLSPYFSEDLPLLPVSYKLHLGVRRWEDFSNNYSEYSICNALGNTYDIVYGSEELERLQERSKEIEKRLKVAQALVIEGVGHDINNVKYQDSILTLV